jgi:branched-chain amino acid transport system substrate-binding protein
MIPSFLKTIEQGGAHVVSDVEFKPDQPSYRAEIEKVYAADPEAVFVPGYVNQFTSIAKEVYRRGYKGKVFSLTIAAAAGIDGSSPFVKNAGKEVAEGIEHVQPISPLDRPEYTAFVKAIGAPEGTVFPFAALQYDAINVLAVAIEKAKSANPVEFAKEIIPITNGPGIKVATGAEALALVRNNEAIDFTGAGQDLKFASAANCSVGHFCIKSSGTEKMSSWEPSVAVLRDRVPRQKSRSSCCVELVANMLG